jgi:hypothetical protein
MLNINFEVKRHRISLTQGEAEVLVNGNLLIRYGDDIQLGGKYGEIIDGYGSMLSDNVFIISAMKHVPNRIINIVKSNFKEEL